MIFMVKHATIMVKNATIMVKHTIIKYHKIGNVGKIFKRNCISKVRFECYFLQNEEKLGCFII